MNENINSYLDYYLSLEVKPEYAILLRGKWGCGKSWFIKNYMQTNVKNKYLYVSLYGITSYKEIEDAFFEQIHPLLASKGMKVAGKIFKGLLKTTLKIDLNGDGKEDGSISPEIPQINLPDYLKNVDDRVLVFDDLERCSMPTTNILGYINQFVENNGLRVIVIGNEEEIIKKDAAETNLVDSKTYLLIKEKLIGKSFDVISDLNASLNSFIKELEDSGRDEIADIVRLKKSLITEIFETADYENLRHLRQSILDLSRLYSYVPKEARENAEFIKDFLILFFAISFELKRGIIHEDDINQLFIRPFGGAEVTNESSVQQIRKKYSIFNNWYYPLNADLWVSFFKVGFIDEELITNVIIKSPYFPIDNTPNWIKLWKLYELNDEEFEEILKKTYDDFKALKITDKYEILQIAGILISLSNKKIMKTKKETIINYAKSGLKKLKKENTFTVSKNEEFPSNGSNGYGYHSLEDSDFLSLLDFAKIISESSIIDEKPEQAHQLLKSLKELNIDKFRSDVTLNNGGSNLYFNVPILKFIPLSDFVEVYLKMPNKEKRELAWTLERRYKFSDFQIDLREELDWLLKLVKALKKERTKRKLKVSGLAIELMLDKLEIAIEALQNAPAGIS